MPPAPVPLPSPQASRPQVVVVGAGPAGLAVAALLTARGIPYVLLEASDAVGHAWREHYDRLHLHTPRWHSHLPLLPMPRHYPRYPSRQQVVDYLQGYADHFGIRPLFGQKVRLARRVGHHWEAITERGDTFTAPHLVVTTGINARPFYPTWPQMEGYVGRVLHSAEYKNGRPFAGQRVLVVGLGNSGGEIVLDLLEHGAAPTLAVRSPVNVIPKEVLGVSYLDLALLMSRLPARIADQLSRQAAQRRYGDLTRYGLRRPAIGPVEQTRTRGRIPIIDIGTIEKIKSGEVKVQPNIAHFTRTGVVFENGAEADFDAVVLATGYRHGLQGWLRVPAEVLERLPQLGGGRTPEDGLYFCGLSVSPTGMLRAINLESRGVVRAIAEQLRT